MACPAIPGLERAAALKTFHAPVAQHLQALRDGQTAAAACPWPGRWGQRCLALTLVLAQQLQIGRAAPVVALLKDACQSLHRPGPGSDPGRPAEWTLWAASPASTQLWSLFLSSGRTSGRPRPVAEARWRARPPAPAGPSASWLLDCRRVVKLSSSLSSQSGTSDCSSDQTTATS